MIRKFPVTIERDGSEYLVHDQSSLDFHLTQGWKVKESDAVDEAPADDLIEFAQAVGKRFDQNEATVADLTSQIHSQEVRLVSLTNQVQVLAEMVASLTAAPPEPTAAAEPAAPDAPPA